MRIYNKKLEDLSCLPIILNIVRVQMPVVIFTHGHRWMQIPVCMHTYTDTYIDRCMLTQACKPTHTHTHTHTCTLSQSNKAGVMTDCTCSALRKSYHGFKH